MEEQTKDARGNGGFDFSQILEELKAGQPLTGEGGMNAPHPSVGGESGP